MTRDAVLGLDAGTSSAKAVVVAADGEIMATASSGPIPSAASEPGGAEQDPERLAAAVDEAAASATGSLPDGIGISALAVAAQSGSVMPIGQDDRPVANLLTWMDTRAGAVVDSWDDDTRRAIRSLSGWSPATGTGLASVCWLRSSRPAVFDRAARWASADDYLAHRLTGRWRTNPSNAAGMQFMDVSRRDWDERLCGIADIHVGQLAPIHRTGEGLGEVGPEAADAIGVDPDIAMVVGGHDQACTALALGATEPGIVIVSVGTAWVLTAITGPVAVDELPVDLNLSPHVVDGLWSASQNLGGLGEMLSWWRRRLHGPDSHPRLIDHDLQTSSGGAPLFLPSLDTRDSSDRGRFEVADPDRPDADLTHAVVESAAFEIRRSIERIVETVAPVEELVLVGGSARSAPLRQLVADVTGRTVTTPADASWPALGAAAVGAAALGWPVPDHASAAAVAEPSDRQRPYHDDRYGAYLRLREGESK